MRELVENGTAGAWSVHIETIRSADETDLRIDLRPKNAEERWFRFAPSFRQIASMNFALLDRAAIPNKVKQRAYSLILSSLHENPESFFLQMGPWSFSSFSRYGRLLHSEKKAQEERLFLEFFGAHAQLSLRDVCQVVHDIGRCEDQKYPSGMGRGMTVDLLRDLETPTLSYGILRWRELMNRVVDKYLDRSA